MSCIVLLFSINSCFLTICQTFCAKDSGEWSRQYVSQERSHTFFHQVTCDSAWDRPSEVTGSLAAVWEMDWRLQGLKSGRRRTDHWQTFLLSRRKTVVAKTVLAAGRTVADFMTDFRGELQWAERRKHREWKAAMPWAEWACKVEGWREWGGCSQSLPAGSAASGLVTWQTPR